MSEPLTVAISLLLAVALAIAICTTLILLDMREPEKREHPWILCIREDGRRRFVLLGAGRVRRVPPLEFVAGRGWVPRNAVLRVIGGGP